MKAEQRKELETNTLADKMGRVMQRVKASPRRTFVTYILVITAALAAAWYGYRWYTGDSEQRSRQWIQLYDGGGAQVEFLATDKESKDSYVAKAAIFQIAWYRYWDEGIKMIGVNPAGATIKLQQAKQIYESLLKDCKDDAVFEPQAMLGRAVCTESLAVQDIANLDKAKAEYKELAEKYGDSGEGQFAKGRLDILNDKAKGAELRRAYVDLGSKDILNVPPAEVRRPFQDKGKGVQIFPAPK